MTNEQIQAQIDYYAALITDINAALTALVLGNAQSYSLDTGQNRQTVTKQSLPALYALLSHAQNQCSVLTARLKGGGSTHVRMV